MMSDSPTDEELALHVPIRVHAHGASVPSVVGALGMRRIWELVKQRVDASEAAARKLAEEASRGR